MLSRRIRVALPLRLLIVGAVLAPLALAHGPAAIAAVTLSVSPDPAPPGATITVRGTGAIPGRVIEIRLDGKFLCDVKADPLGNFPDPLFPPSPPCTVSKDAALGGHLVRAVGGGVDETRLLEVFPGVTNKERVICKKEGHTLICRKFSDVVAEKAIKVTLDLICAGTMILTKTPSVCPLIKLLPRTDLIPECTVAANLDAPPCKELQGALGPDRKIAFGHKGRLLIHGIG